MVELIHNNYGVVHERTYGRVNYSNLGDEQMYVAYTVPVVVWCSSDLFITEYKSVRRKMFKVV